MKMINYVEQCNIKSKAGIGFQILPDSIQQQKGAALITSLIFLILLTVLGFSASRGVIMQELISRNFSDQNLAFQAAEAALKYAEACIRVSDGKRSGASISVSSLCTPGNAIPTAPYADITLRNATTTFWTTTGTQFGGSTLGGGTLTLPSGALSAQPSYVIALMNWVICKDLKNKTKCIYQITASGVGVNPNSQKIVQSIYRF